MTGEVKNLSTGPAPSNGPTQWWQKIARRIRVPLGFAMAAAFLLAAACRQPRPLAIALSLVLVLPGLALRAAASGTVKKNRELAVTGPYAYTRNPLYLGSALIAAGFALALASWPVALVLICGFAAIYIPVIASEENFLRGAFANFDEYCRQVPRFFPRLTAAKLPPGPAANSAAETASGPAECGFSFALYRKHREYNAAVGAALLYLCLLFLRPAVEAVLLRAR
jgi:protein-S-isoprenylcysteine O-methyltransferase Ste14